MHEVNRFVNSEDYENIRQEVGDSVLLNFTLLGTAYQSIPSAMQKNKPDYCNLEGTTKENSHFTKMYCEVPGNQTWHCIKNITDTSV